MSAQTRSVFMMVGMQPFEVSPSGVIFVVSYSHSFPSWLLCFLFSLSLSSLDSIRLFDFFSCVDVIMGAQSHDS